VGTYKANIRWHRQPHERFIDRRYSRALQHAAVELLRGTMAKHNFIAYRDDRAGASQPITFDGDGWRAYVPLRLPWTLCIRDRRVEGPLGRS
jgi:hypothetical protein